MLVNKVEIEDGIVKDQKKLGSASIVKMTVPKDLLEELNIDEEIFSYIYLVLTCAHNVIYKDLKEGLLKKATEVIAIVGK